MDTCALDHPRRQIGGLTGQQAELADEGARTESDQRRLGVICRSRTNHFDHAFVDHDQVVARIAGRKRGLANLERVRRAVVAQSRQLGICQLGANGKRLRRPLTGRWLLLHRSKRRPVRCDRHRPTVRSLDAHLPIRDRMFAP
jgi:hypothetical protein